MGAHSFIDTYSSGISYAGILTTRTQKSKEKAPSRLPHPNLAPAKYEVLEISAHSLSPD